ncbi:hypothetical protein ABZY14_39890 [Streptomyces sp. NPDC006617]|uniref:hypothetical protein n=1 Tax=Streptomyces sp. NPDC006617 TaxID=3155354 RepID=UPI0033B64A61
MARGRGATAEASSDPEVAPALDPEPSPDPAAELVLDAELPPEPEAAPDADPDPDSARCTGSSPVAPPVVALGTGPGRGAERCTGDGVPDAVSLPERGRAGPSPVLGRRAAARWTGGPGVVDRCSAEGAEEVRGVGAGPDDGAAAPCAGDDVPRSCVGAGGVVGPGSRAVRCTGAAGDDVPRSCAGAGGVVGPGSRAVRCTGVPLSRAGVVVGRAGGVGAGPLPSPGSRAVRCTGAAGDDVPRSCVGAGGVVGPGSRAVRCTGVPLSRAGAVVGRAGGVGAGPLPSPGSRAARCTGVLGAGVLDEGVPDDRVLDDGVRDDVPPSRTGVVPPPDRGSARRTGMSEGGRVPEPASGAGVFAPGAAAVRADAARCTGGSAGAGEPADGGCCCAPAARCAGAPGPARSPSVDEGAVRADDGGVSAVRRLAGRDRRCTADAPDGALVRACRGRGAAGGTGVTRTPRADWAGVFDGVAAVAAGVDPAARAARWTGGVAVDPVDGVGPGADAAPRAPPRLPPGAAPAADVRVAGTGAAGAPGAASSAGIARRGATGIRCTGGVPGGGARGVDEG